MKKEITFLTGNKDKINSAGEVFKDYPSLVLKIQDVDLPEIQSIDVKEVAEYYVKVACKKLNKPVFKTDCGYYFEGLNGFPGALVKYFDRNISSQDLLKLLENKSKKVIVRECLSYCEPGKVPVSFIAELQANIASKPKGNGGTIDKLIVYEGFKKPQAACDYDKIIAYWNARLTHYKDFANYLTNKSSRKKSKIIENKKSS